MPLARSLCKVLVATVIPFYVPHAWDHMLVDQGGKGLPDSDEMMRARQAWIELSMFAKAVLRKHKRGQRAQQSFRFTQALLMRWKEGERETLWAELPSPPSGKSKVNNSVEAKQQSCMRLSALGRRSQAVQRLISPGLAEDTPAVRDKLLSKFPAFDHSQGPARLHPRPPTQIDVQTTDGCIKSFPNGNGPGPTGLRADFLKQCISSDEDDGCSALFAETCANFLQTGMLLLTCGRGMVEVA